MANDLESLVSPLGSETLDLEATRTKLKDYLISNDIIKDVNYLGSNISQMVDILSYVLVQANSNMALLSNEVFLPLATLRRNVLTKAKELNYNISRKKSAIIQVEISADITDETETVTIPRFTTFTGGDFTFVNTEEILLTFSSSTQTVNLKEGTYIDYTTDENLRFTLSEEAENITINYQDIENDGIFFRLKPASSSDFSELWTKGEFLLDLIEDEKVFYEEYDVDTGWVILRTYFAGQGNILSPGDIYDIGILLSSGIDANGIPTVELADTVTNNTGEEKEITVTSLTASSGGTEEESTESVKRNAPLFYNSGLRLVNEIDYEAILEKNSLVEKAVSWGGETMIPEDLGSIYLSVLPQAPNQRYLTDLERAQLIKFMKNTRIIATNRKFRVPHYMFVDVQVKILGDIPNLVEKQNQINTALNEMFNGEYYNFKIQFYESKLIRTVENVFENDMRSGIDVVISPKILLTEEMFQELNASDYLEIYVPNALKRFKLVKNDTVINVPENYQDELTYLLDGWTKEYVYEEDIDVTFSGTLNSKTITTGAKETSGDIEIKRINLDATEVGYFDVTNSILYLQDLNTELDPFADDYIEVSYDTGMNVKLLKNAFLQLGDVTYV